MLSENSDTFDTSLSVPCNIDAEQTIIGALLLEPETVLSATQGMKSDYFYDSKCSAIFDVVMIMYTQGIKVDAITVLNSAMMHGVFETEQEGRNYIAAITDSITSIANIDSYCTIVTEKYRIRSLMHAAKDILNNISTNAYSAQQLIDSAEQSIFNIREGKNLDGLTKLRDFIFKTYEHICNLAGPDREMYLGAKTGFAPLDTMITGLNKSDLIILAARPGMGKTSFAMNIAMYVARHNPDSKVAVFSLEMPKQQLAARLLSTEACVESHKMRTGRIDPKDEWIRLAQATQILAEAPILIDDTSSITVPQMKAKLRREENLGLVIIDYLQLISTDLRTESRVSIVAEITRQLKIMAKELDVPVILLSQLSRSPEARTDKRPLLSDLRDSGAIEQDADIVLFLYRDGYYNKESKTPNISECIVAKNRHGETGKVELYWDGQYTRFSVIEKNAQPN